MSDKIEQILTGLNNKANLKQDVYGHSLKVFNEFKTCALNVVDTLAPKILSNAEGVEINLNSFGDFEFHLNFLATPLFFYCTPMFLRFRLNMPLIKVPMLKKIQIVVILA